MKKVFQSLFLLLAGLFLVSCSTAPITGRQQLKLVDDEKLASQYSAEYDQMIAQLKQQGLLANSTKDGIRVKNVGDRLATAVEKYLKENGQAKKVDYLNWEFNLIKSNEVNAFALPGGKIAFYTGIMPIAKNDAKVKLLKARYKYGMVLMGLSILGYHSKKENEDIEQNDVCESIKMFSEMISPVLLPMIDVMGDDMSDIINE